MAARLEDLLGKHGSSKSMVEQTLTGAVVPVAAFVHAGAKDEVLKKLLAALGLKACEINSCKVLLALADAVRCRSSTGSGDSPAGNGCSSWRERPHSSSA